MIDGIDPAYSKHYMRQSGTVWYLEIEFYIALHAVLFVCAVTGRVIPCVFNFPPSTLYRAA